MESLRITIRSTLELCEYLWKKNYKYILTAKLNQDPLERDFGLIRGLSCDDHPTVINFTKLHALQTIYAPIKGVLSKASNCEDTLTSFTSNVRKPSSFKYNTNTLIKSSFGKVEEKLKFLDQCEHSKLTEHDYFSNTTNEALTDDICGYILSKSKKYSECQKCIASLCASTPEISDANIITAFKDYGGKLYYPSKSVLSLFMTVEEILEEKLGAPSRNLGNIFHDILDSLTDLTVYNDVGRCKDHCLQLIPKLLIYYIETRIFFKTKENNKKKYNS